jgi:hypothetical protein
VVRVLVDHNLIASPVPVRDDVVIVGGHVPVEIAKPEAFPVSSRKHEYMLRPKATGEASMCKRLIDAVVRIVGATVMSDPLVVLGMNVGNFRMISLVDGNAVLGRGSGLLTSRRGRSAWSTGSPRRSGTVSGNVSAANRGVPAAAWLSTVTLACTKTAAHIRIVSPVIVFFTPTSWQYIADARALP